MCWLLGGTSSWQQTRKANGDIVQTRVSNKVNAWKSGKFMDLSARPWSLNSYALTKAWFRCHTVDLRVADITSLTGKVKGWLYQDQLEKPEDMVNYRPPEMGGLGLHHVGIKAQASLIRTFMETAANATFQQSMFHNILYRAYVLADDSIQSPPPMPPYYSQNFFNKIKWVKQNTPLNVCKMTTAQWYRVLLEKEVTMVDTENNDMEYIKCRSELASPNTNWELSWSRIRLKGLGSEATSFLWKLLHRILPTEERVSRIIQNSSPNCRQCPTAPIADLEHAFFTCVSTQQVGRCLLSTLRLHSPGLTSAGLLRLDYAEQGDNEMPVAWFAAQTLLYMWGVRKSGRIVDLMTTRAHLESKINLLRETRHSNKQVIIREIFRKNDISLLFELK